MVINPVDPMTPDDVAERLAAWVEVGGVTQPTSASAPMPRRRVECVEPGGSRRTWTLFENGQQVGMVQGRIGMDPLTLTWDAWTWGWYGAWLTVET